MKNRIRHADELPYDGTAAGLAAGDVQAAIDEVMASVFDPDDPLSYLTMVDTVTGDVVQVSVANGAWAFTTVDFRVTEAGDTRITEDGNVRITEG